MSNEIELKLLVNSAAEQALKLHFFPALEAKCQHAQQQLFNHYYDTREGLLSDMGIGFRVRGKDGHYEQTIKTSGTSHGGLHQRPEYNVDLGDNQPKLALFPQSIWPQKLDVEQLQSQIVLRFTTHFHRSTYLLTFDNGDELELVFDQGKVEAGEHQEDICEIELELVKGCPGRLFEVARNIMQVTPCRMGLFSKAARGNQLLRGEQFLPKPELAYLSIEDGDTLDTVFVRTAQYALEHWQYHEQSYLQTQKLSALNGVKQSIELLIQAMALYGPLLAEAAMAELMLKCDELLHQWSWLEQGLALKSLCSRKGYYHKKLDKYPEMVSFLQGRIQGAVMQNDPEVLFQQGAHIQLALAELMQIQPWSQNTRVSLHSQAANWLEKTWLEVKQSLSTAPQVDEGFWLQQQDLLKNTLLRGILLANSYGQEVTQDFRKPWLDLLDGIEELALLTLLQQEALLAEEAFSQVISEWAQQKVHNLLPLLEESRQQALSISPYWH